MRLEDYVIEPRRRTGWEVMDLGTLLLQRNLGSILRSSLLLGLPILAATAGLVVSFGFFWGYIFLWLMRPLYGRITLFVLSRAVFASHPTPREIARAMPGFLSKGLLGAVLIRPFTLSRVVVEPVLLLEGLRGQALRKRSAVLLGEGVRGQIWWGATAVFLVMVVILLSLLALVYGFAPAGMESLDPKAMVENPSALVAWVALTCLALSIAVIEPLWVAVGFAAYLNRRSDLEGWDVELVFRRLAQRASQGVRLSSVTLLAVFALLPMAPQSETPVQRPVDVVFEREEFKTTVTVTRRRGSQEFSPALVELFKLMAWILLGIVVGLILLRLIQWAMGLDAPAARAKVAPETGALELAGLDLRRESLPRDVVAEARTLWDAGQVKDAVSLLYRASLVVLRDQHGLFIEDGDTEGRCMRKVTALEVQELGIYFGGLTDRWTRLAYGGEGLGESDFSGLAQGYGTHFGGRK